MRAEVIAVGDELTSGAQLDTNSQWLSQQLQQVGIQPAYHTTVGDDLDAVVAVIHAAVARADVVILGGGLGPTADDLVRQALAKAVDRPLVMNSEALQHIRGLFTRRGRSMPERNAVQAEFPDGSDILANPHGTAPGIHLTVGASAQRTSHLYALPGVPAELKEMWIQSVRPGLVQILGGSRRVIRHRVLHCFGAGESDIEQRLPDLVRRGRRPAVGITASQATISLRVTADGESSAACLAAMEPTVHTIRQCLGTLVYGEGDDTLQDVTSRLLQQQRLCLATAEIGTQGLLSAWLAHAEPSRWYRGGVVLADHNAAGSVLNIRASDDKDDDQAEAGTRWVATMAIHVRDRLQADLGLAVGPVVPPNSPPNLPDEPQDELPDELPGQIHLALAIPGSVVTASFLYAGHPSIRQPLAAKRALDLLRRWLLEQQRECSA